MAREALERYVLLDENDLDEVLNSENITSLVTHHIQVFRDKVTGEYVITNGGFPAGTNILGKSLPQDLAKKMEDFKKQQQVLQETDTEKQKEVVKTISNIKPSKENEQDLSREKTRKIDEDKEGDN